MAIIQCDIRRGRTDEQKRRLAAGLTEVVSEVTGEPVGFVKGDHRTVAAMLDVDSLRGIGLVAGRNDGAVHGIHFLCSSISLARNAAHAAVAKISTTSRGILASPPATQWRLYSCAGPSHSAAVTPTRIGRSAP